MSGEWVFVSLIAEASLVVKLVMLALALASLASWAVIFRKRSLLKQADGFERGRSHPVEPAEVRDDEEDHPR